MIELLAGINIKFIDQRIKTNWFANFWFLYGMCNFFICYYTIKFKIRSMLSSKMAPKLLVTPSRMRGKRSLVRGKKPREIDRSAPCPFSFVQHSSVEPAETSQYLNILTTSWPGQKFSSISPLEAPMLAESSWR